MRLSLAALFAVSGSVVSAASARASGPLTQSADTLQLGRQAPSIALYTTELDNPVVGAGSEVGYEMEGEVSGLPCPGKGYKLLDSRSSINSSQASSYEATVDILRVWLPTGLKCGTSLPESVSGDEASVSVVPMRGGESGAPTFYPAGRISLESRRPCVTLAGICAGTYLLTASFRGDGLDLRASYLFVVKPTPQSERPEVVTLVEACPRASFYQ